MRQPERGGVEWPVIAQLEAMGWTHLPFAEPGAYSPESGGSGRDGFAEVALPGRLRAALRNLNPGPGGEPWLDDDRLATITNRVLRDPKRGVAGNIAFTELLTGAELTVDGLPDWNHGAPQPVHVVNWAEPGRNDLLAVSRFRVDTPEGPRPHVVLDVVLFVNGRPLVVIKCEDPAPTAVDDAIGRLLGDAGAGSAAPAGDLTRFAQLLVAMDRERAVYGTVTTPADLFAGWRMVDPSSAAKISAELGRTDHTELSAQEILVSEILRPARLLELVRNFSIRATSGGRPIKVMARWPQYRAGRRITRELLDRQRRLAADPTAKPDHRGGVIWHTQGSGKSFTMTFLVRVLRTEPELAGFKVVVVTDRLDLEDQVMGSLGGSGETPHRANSAEGARSDLARQTPDLILVTIQKAQRDEDAGDGEDERLGEETHVHAGVANDSSRIVVLVDEAHRSQDSWLHARLRAMLPNAVLIGFTGTPILKGSRKHTEDIFGNILDAYTLKDAERDGAVVPVTYEAWEADARLVDRALLDAGFVDAAPADARERRRVMARFARRREVLEAADLITAKAEHMLDHWLRNVMPDRFSAQVVAVSRRAAVRYRDALLAARNRLLREIDELPAGVRTDPLADTDERTRFLLGLLPHRDVLEQFDAVPVISPGPRQATANTPVDPPGWREWTDKNRQRQHIARFKAGLGAIRVSDPDPGSVDHGGAVWHSHPVQGTDGDPWDQPRFASAGDETGDDKGEPIAFLTVKLMLLTGFDAPVEQVLYLDRPMRSVELLQAIARTNRPMRNKQYGIIVDYIGIAAEVARAMKDYEPEHLTEVIGDADPRSVLAPLNEKAVPELARRHDTVRNMLLDQGIRDLSTVAGRAELLDRLDEPGLRATFDEVTREFLRALNAVLPRPEALEYRDIARQLGTVQYLARRRYRDGRRGYSPLRCGEKVRQLIDEHIRATGILLRVPPTAITADDFVAKVEELGDDRASALELKHALRDHITTRIDADPVIYRRLSERLEAILRRMADDHDYGQAVVDLLGLRADVVAQETAADEDDLDRWTERPVYTLFQRAIAEQPTARALSEDELKDRVRVLSAMIGHAVDVPHYANEQRESLRRKLADTLIMEHGFKMGPARHTADELVSLAARNRDWFLRLVRS